MTTESSFIHLIVCPVTLNYLLPFSCLSVHFGTALELDCLKVSGKVTHPDEAEWIEQDAAAAQSPSIVAFNKMQALSASR